MPFAVADDKLLEGVAVGDKVSVTLEVHWEGEAEPLQITEVEVLPADTMLTFEQPEDASQGTQDEMSDPS